MDTESAEAGGGSQPTAAASSHKEAMGETETWLPDGYSQIFRLHVFGPLCFWTMAPLHYAAKLDPFLS